jgi:choline/glycine/proline betaine transport protein
VGYRRPVPLPDASPNPFERIGLPNGRSRLAVAIVVTAVLGALLSIETASVALAAAKAWVVGYFDWLFVLVANAAVFGVVLLAIHPLAKGRLGDDDSRPEFSRLSWFAMLFSAGLASGLLYWATAEPIIHLQGNPFLLDPDAQLGGGGGGVDAIATAMRITILHWGVHGWAFYVLAALAISIYAYRHGQPLTFRTALYPILGPKWIDRWPGTAVDLLALFGTVCGVATSIGLSAGSMNATLGSLFDIENGATNQIVIIFGVCVLGTLSALSGVARGIRRLSELNVWVSVGLLAAFLLLGPTLFLGELILRTIVDYLVHVVPTGLWIGETAEERAWQGDWTVFYWGWWLAWTPFVSLFIARISKGRTIREFAIAVMLVPTFVTIIWMCVLGGTAISQESAVAGSVSETVNLDYSLGLIAVIENLASPQVAGILVAIAAFLLFTWLITSLDSATLVVCHILKTEDSAAAKIFWGFALASVAAVLLRAGGLDALQAASIVVGLPLAGLMVLIGLGLLRDFARGRL